MSTTKLRAPTELDRTDRAILRALQRDASVSNVALAAKVNLSAPACLRRVERLRAAGFIKGVVALLDPDALEVGMLVMIGVVLDRRFGGPEYGLPNEGTLEAIRLSARFEGMLTDPVYEGKSMHGMIEKVRLGEFPAGSKVLYAHLGGVPALNAYSFLFRNG